LFIFDQLGFLYQQPLNQPITAHQSSNLKGLERVSSMKCVSAIISPKITAQIMKRKENSSQMVLCPTYCDSSKLLLLD
jgi:hypothetical protein